MQNHKSTIERSGELSARRFPKSGFSQIVAVIQNRLLVSVFNSEVRPTRAFDLAVFVVGRKVVSRIGLDGDELTNTRVGYAGAVEGDEQGAVASMEITGIERERDALLFFVLPVEAPVQNIEMEVSVNYQVVSSWKVRRQAKARSRLLPD